MRSEKIYSSYTDEEESTFDLEKIKDKLKARITGFTSRLKRKQRLEDMPDNRGKLRFIYKMMLGRFARKNMAVPESMTPDELCSDRFGDGSAETFFVSYNKARYSDKEVVDSEVDNAINVVGRV